MEYTSFMKELRHNVSMFNWIQEGEATEYIEAHLEDDDQSNKDVKRLYVGMKKAQRLIKSFIYDLDKNDLKEGFETCRQMDWIYPAMTVELSPMLVRVSGFQNGGPSKVEWHSNDTKYLDEAMAIKDRFYNLGLALDSIQIEIGVINIVKFNFSIDDESALEIIRRMRDNDVLYVGSAVTLKYVGY